MIHRVTSRRSSRSSAGRSSCGNTTCRVRKMERAFSMSDLERVWRSERDCFGFGAKERWASRGDAMPWEGESVEGVSVERVSKIDVRVEREYDGDPDTR